MKPVQEMMDKVAQNVSVYTQGILIKSDDKEMQVQNLIDKVKQTQFSPSKKQIVYCTDYSKWGDTVNPLIVSSIMLGLFAEVGQF